MKAIALRFPIAIALEIEKRAAQRNQTPSEFIRALARRKIRLAKKGVEVKP